MRPPVGGSLDLALFIIPPAFLASSRASAHFRGAREGAHKRRRLGYKPAPPLPATSGTNMDSVTAASGAHHHPRVEDDILVRGAGHFVADRTEPNQAAAWFVRSPHAFARIRALDIAAAKRAPGVLAVLTGADMEAAAVGNVGRHPPLTGRGGHKMILPTRPAIARA